MARHRVVIPDLAQVAPSLTITGEEAHHAARVKRLEPGDSVELLDGRGRVARAVVEQVRKDQREWALDVVIREIRLVEPVRPRLEVWSATPKGGRLDEMIEGLSEVGAASWAPLHAERSDAEPRPGKLDRLSRICAEAAKQCGRAWFMTIDRGGDLAAALRHAAVIVADASGTPFDHAGAPELRLLVGPEGGWSERELAHFAASNLRIHRFGPHAMRIETAAVVAAGVVLRGATSGG